MQRNEIHGMKAPDNQHFTKIDEMIKEFNQTKEKDPDLAFKIIKGASDCGNISAQLEYCRFLRTTPALHVNQSTRYQEAERVLLELFNLIDIPRQFSIDVALELVALYSEHLHRPVGALGMCLYARRMGGTIDENCLAYLNKRMVNSDINLLGDNYRDDLLLGQELHHAGGVPRLTEFFLREAVDRSYAAVGRKEKGARLVYAQAALALGDFYDNRLDESPVFRNERDVLYAAARAYGYPEYLSKSNL